MARPRIDSGARARDAGLARLRRATRVTFFGATALAGAIAGLAAHSAPGHKAAITTSAGSAVKRTQRAMQPHTATRAQSDDQQQVQSQPVTPAVAPTPTTVAPVTVTGGS